MLDNNNEIRMKTLRVKETDKRAACPLFLPTLVLFIHPSTIENWQ